MVATRFGPERLLEPLTAHVWHFAGQSYWGEEVHTYLVEDGGRLFVIDAPNHKSPAAGWLGTQTPPADIYLTHAAASGDAALWQRHAHLRVALNALDLDSRWLRCRPDLLLEGDRQLTPHLRALHAPGHSPGHTMYYDDRDGGSLFSGDALLRQRGRWEIELVPEARGKLAGLPFARLLPNHYDLLREGAHEQVLLALDGGIRR
jgi:glyoxylase-like metal-dependent hydrolase (beta-lactamase superfamily II)